MMRVDALRIISEYYRDCPIVATCGATSRELRYIGDRENQLYVVDSMGLSPSIAIGISLVLKDTKVRKVVAVEGDGGILMNANALSSAAFLRPSKLVVIIMDNGCFASTGGQRAQGSQVPIPEVASGFGLPVHSVNNIADLQRCLIDVDSMNGPIVVHVNISSENVLGLPYIHDDPVVLASRFKTFILDSISGTERSGSL